MDEADKIIIDVVNLEDDKAIIEVRVDIVDTGLHTKRIHPVTVHL